MLHGFLLEKNTPFDDVASPQSIRTPGDTLEQVSLRHSGPRASTPNRKQNLITKVSSKKITTNNTFTLTRMARTMTRLLAVFLRKSWVPRLTPSEQGGWRHTYHRHITRRSQTRREDIICSRRHCEWLRCSRSAESSWRCERWNALMILHSLARTKSFHALLDKDITDTAVDSLTLLSLGITNNGNYLPRIIQSAWILQASFETAFLEFRSSFHMRWSARSGKKKWKITTVSNLRWHLNSVWYGTEYDEIHR